MLGLAACAFRVLGIDLTGPDAGVPVDGNLADVATPADGPPIADGPSLLDGALLDGALLDGASLDGARLDGAQPDLLTCVTSCATGSCSPCCTVTYSGSADQNQSCPSGCSCQLSCSGPNNCHFSCASGTTCTASADNANTGTIDCSAGSSCQLKCGGNVSDSCTVNCNNASCLVACGAANNCNLNCPGPVTSCPGNIKVCGRPCPPP